MPPVSSYDVTPTKASYYRRQLNEPATSSTAQAAQTHPTINDSKTSTESTTKHINRSNTRPTNNSTNNFRQHKSKYNHRSH
ncbi:hypothetical protein CVS40_11359 [Lucilia cuprina]|nr:hypothetical protein CVS40_11359 [Lucilia cuprina]